MRTIGISMLMGLALGGCVGHAQSSALVTMQHNREKMAVDQRQKQLALDAENLLAMAQTLKISVDGTRKDELSMDVIRKADEIEKLARSVKDRMRQ